MDTGGNRVSFLIASSCLLLPGHALLNLTSYPPVYGIIFLGLGLSFASTAVWPSIPLVVPPDQLGAAYGVATAVQNMALFLAPLIMGSIRDRTGDYRNGLGMYVCIDLLALAAAVNLLRLDRKLALLTDESPLLGATHSVKLLQRGRQHIDSATT